MARVSVFADREGGFQVLVELIRWLGKRSIQRGRGPTSDPHMPRLRKWSC